MKKLTAVTIAIVALFVITLSSHALMSDRWIPLVSEEAFSDRFSAFIEDEASWFSLTSVPSSSEADPTSGESSAYSYNSDGCKVVYFVDASNSITAVTGQIKFGTKYISVYYAVLYALSKYDQDIMWYSFTDEVKSSVKINYWINGYERFLSFAGLNVGDDMLFVFRSDVKRSMQFLNEGTYTVGIGYVQAGEYVATASSSGDAYLRVIRKRKAVYYGVLSKNIDTDRILLFDGDVIEVRLNTAILRPI